MPPKPTIIYIIDDLGIGGAESLLIGILKDMSRRFSIILVTLNSKCEYDQNAIFSDYKYSLGVSNNKLSLLSGVLRLRKIIKKHSPILVHSHLFYSSLLARAACPAGIPLLFSVHSQLTKYVFEKSIALTVLEKNTIRKEHWLLAVSNATMKDYERTINFTGRKFVLENYIDDKFYSGTIEPPKYRKGCELKIVAVGNIKKAKNYEYLLNAFMHLKGLPVKLDIYGKKDDPVFDSLQSFVMQNDLPVTFKGIATNVVEVFPLYNLYVMSSIHEGFGIAAVEALACGLPAMLSDLEVLREISWNNAIFFDISNPEAFAVEIKKILNEQYDLQNLSEKGIAIAKKYSKQNYLDRLNAIYDEATESRRM